MKAIQFKTFGTPDVLEYVELPTPKPAAGHALIRVKSASVNPSDVKNVSGHFGHTQLPRVPGRDFSGTVVAGPDEWLGADVWGTGGDIGFTRNGTHAEFIEVPAAALARKPASLDHAQAASIGVNFVVAWLGTVEYARVEAGETIAVIGVSGGVGGAVTQIAKARGARVIGIDRHEPHPDSPAARLVDEFVPFDDQTAARVRELTGGAGAEVVYDAVGGVAFELALSLAKRRGRVVEISATGRRRVEFDLIDFYHNETQLLGADSAKLGVVESAPIMTAIAEGFDAGRFEAPVVALRFPLERAREAYEAVAGGTRGRVVIDAE
ncbi:quinone oxidoreductase family protein [Paraburkholderia caballeronis]|uniref:NADPH:quinone reductase n=1 Tax=Paraburkholderia caballeronis TaxID=416943 RepID=A0A1H7R284_9BURK|nr:zinc-binding alcohol dehydrogenase family protein [Paraburkholderia caballeronis]PXW23698.1 NADPH:quinone reductase-like Zn-dependent oxidoreductase [Paraburkholderia caballeronis]PXW99039.1 NADPH:quinone reductase-like Zn-dependent oxidoreductase [Paraburkholderia caballeronis]RAJ96245.1 NADPH:quinone reductase-like Zn-dependent oxidoreductase [Paraburkholderia caballeronis]SEC84229.1 NADPH:quinone reductase [Paraburkholderia caballeronis]SEL54283.1 NADPH:quinone reductase [Paraburkholderi